MNKFKKESDFVVSLTPYRISLGGGGTDLPFYSKLKGGNLITAAINQYCKFHNYYSLIILCNQIPFFL